jgi:hypothetical protein
MAEFSRQCAHAGGTPLPWKTAELCGKNRQISSFNLQPLIEVSSIPLIFFPFCS